MSTAAHWPKHFYLIAGAASRLGKDAGPDSMGGKAHNLRLMGELGLPVPQALVIGTQYTRAGEECLAPLKSIGLPSLEAATGLKLGDERHPLIVSVRSGAPVSMPGMLETILNVGLCDRSIAGLLRQTGHPRMVWDAYRRLIATYGEVVADIPAERFEAVLRELSGGRDERSLDFSEHRAIAQRNLDIFQAESGRPFPQDPYEQLKGAILAVFRSWDMPKAKTYRQINGLDEAMGTAVTIQRMVFGNTGLHSGAGVGFTRDPATGAPGLWLDFLTNAQGEDVVAGRRNAHGGASLQASAPEAWSALQMAAGLLEQRFQDMQDFEFTVQDGALFLLQTRAGKRTALAGVRITLDLLQDGLIDRDQAWERLCDVGPDALTQTCLVADEGAESAALAAAIPASAGVVTGEVALDETRLQDRRAAGVDVILVRAEAQTSDIGAVQAAKGLLTQRGARTSHAAVVARQLGKVCLVGCDALRIDDGRREIRFGDIVLREGDIVTLDGNAGAIYRGAMRVESRADPELTQRLAALRADVAESLPA